LGVSISSHYFAIDGTTSNWCVAAAKQLLHEEVGFRMIGISAMPGMPGMTGMPEICVKSGIIGMPVRPEMIGTFVTTGMPGIPGTP